MIEDCKGVDKSINEVVLVLHVSVGGRLLVLGASQPTDNEPASSGVFLNLESKP